MFENIYIKQRIEKTNVLRELGHNPYGNNLKRTISNANFLQTYNYLKSATDSSDIDSSETESSNIESSNSSMPKIEYIVGRVRFMRLMGKACFIKIQDESGILQAYISKNDVGEDGFMIVKKLLEVGDIINVGGYAFVTKTNELSIHAKDINILTKAIIPLPEKFHGLSDVELRYRQRYVDLIMNAEVKELFCLRSKIISSVRAFFEEKGFLEVETPMLHPIPGGANAKPFITHHNALNVDRYLRIAPELYLKRLIVGGFEAVFEMNRNFRNEGMDHSHNPEFSTIEFYWAYHTYNDLINLTKELFSFILTRLNIPSTLQIDNEDNTKTIDFTSWNILNYKEALISLGGIPKDAIQNAQNLYDFLTSKHIKLDTNIDIAMNYGKLQDIAFSEFVESKLINPTFIIDYPIDISPLARRKDDNKEVAERFELFINGKEIANGFSELNDPIDQYERFKQQVRQKDAGDEEAQYMDEDFVNALGYGMPPTAGEGIGIDRLVMLLTNAKSIKDVLLFPAMKPEVKSTQNLSSTTQSTPYTTTKEK